ncbi:MAG: hypothetical protein NZM43_13385 [Saprospiraceae bacterium]|nr:hypothetical protein [Saprospiraceae bacterium]MDW8485308.1 hypothetical protein [Saprospiraceae bacterium]
MSRSALKLFSIAVLWGLARPLNGQDTNHLWLNNVRVVYYQIISLRLTEAQAGLQQLHQCGTPPPVIYLLASYADFVRAMVDEQSVSIKYFHQKTERYIEALQHLSPSSPWTQYAEAEIRFQRAVLQAKTGAYFAAARQIWRVCSLLEENRRRFPHFALNQKSLAFIQAFMGALPEEFRWASTWLSGLVGSVTEGVGKLERLLAASSAEVRLFEEEIRLVIAFLRLNLLEDRQGAWQVLQCPGLDARQNPLAAYSLAVVAGRLGRNDEAIRLLEACPDGAPFYPFWQRYYLLGVLKMNRLDADADQPLRCFVRHFCGETGRWDACRKIAWYYLLHGDTLSYRMWMARIAAAKHPQTEQDRAAYYEARSEAIPNCTLLRARLLFDGGYFLRAYDILSRQPASSYSGEHYLEYVYRRARLAQALQRLNEAEYYYRQTLEYGRYSPLYYACYAALQLGVLCENARRCAEAKKYYYLCLRIRPHMYRLSLHAKAKAALARMQKKC